VKGGPHNKHSCVIPPRPRYTEVCTQHRRFAIAFREAFSTFCTDRSGGARAAYYIHQRKNCAVAAGTDMPRKRASKRLTFRSSHLKDEVGLMMKFCPDKKIWRFQLLDHGRGTAFRPTCDCLILPFISSVGR